MKGTDEQTTAYGTDARSLTLPEWEAYLAKAGLPRYRAGQIYGWLHKHGAASYEEMTNLPAALRERLAGDLPIAPVTEAARQVSALDGTQKFLFEMGDGNAVESVFMKYHHGNSVCISSQAGCRMGCRFCASTIGGLDRNLTPGEMLGQIYQIRRLTGEEISNIVVMGTGEPFDNYDNLVRFLRLLTDPKGFGLSARSVTVSTCGLVPRIYQFAEEGIPCTLAISLHASDDETRRRMMPIAEKYSIAEILAACRTYFEKTGRRVTFEYSLAAGVNDSPEAAKALAALVKGLNCHINLIPINPVRGREFAPSARPSCEAFKLLLEKQAIHVTIRRELGRDIDGACGQLRHRQKHSAHETGEE